MHADSISSPARVRAGGTVLSLLAAPLVVPILRAHREGPLRLPDLRERLGGAAQTTLRGQVSSLRDIGALERTVLSGMPYTVVNSLTPAGEGILDVADLVEAWLANAPQGPIILGSEAAKGSIRSLVGGWDSTILHALADQPLSLTELDNAITEISYPSLERRLSAMRAARQVEVQPSDAGQAKPYAVTEWTRRAVTSLVGACRCECEHFSDTTGSLARVDIEAAFLLAVPLIDLEESRSGSCLFAVDRTGVGGERLAGVQIAVEDGCISSCVSQLTQDPETWVLGTIGSWIETILDGRRDGLRLGGRDQVFARAVIGELRRELAPSTAS